MCSYVEADRILSFNSREFIEAGDDKPCAAIAGCTAFSVFSRCRRTLKKYCHPQGQDEGGRGSVIGFDAVVDGHAPLLRSPRLHQAIPRLERKRRNEPNELFQTVLPRCCALDRNRFPSRFFFSPRTPPSVPRLFGEENPNRQKKPVKKGKKNGEDENFEISTNE